MAVVTIVGAGMMGTAMCWPLVDNGHTVRLAGTPLDDGIIESVRSSRYHPTLRREIPARVVPYFASELPAALEGADLVIGGVSSFGVEWFARNAGPLLPPGAPVLSVTKGMEVAPDGMLEILPIVLDRLLPPEKQGHISLNAIAGPCIAHELAARRETMVVFTGHNQITLERMRDLLATPYYFPQVSTDIVGVEVCAALKNAYAMGVGLAVGVMEAAGPDGLAQMYNPQAALFGQACLEMRRLVRLLGGREENIAWLPGAGDLYVTVFGGRTVALGKLLGQGKPFWQAREILAGQTLESVEIITRVSRALPRLASRGLVDLRDFPLMLHMDGIINQGKTPFIPWEKFRSEPYG